MRDDLAGALAGQDVTLKVDAGGTLEWLPQESIVFDGVRASMRTRVELACWARYLGLDTLCLGRRFSVDFFFPVRRDYNEGVIKQTGGRHAHDC